MPPLSATTRSERIWEIMRGQIVIHPTVLILGSGEIRNYGRYPEDPLTSRIYEIPLKKRVSLHLNFYDGRDDPKQWITSFMIAMRRQKYASPEEQNAHFCQALAEHLRGNAQAWFGNLRADSIDSFDDLAAAFLKQHLRFALDDLVLCKTDDDTIYSLGKFGPDWEGPFRVAKVIKPGVYQLEDNLGITSDRLWSSSDLRKFHD
ncbi:unnamed protein product [Microthlaspi erraticum]|uniref:Retrotransposon gag domain-containing protein n=1 Tax=Microthlaspi erraticum TaxID=1685480 RepID=A0A6D2ITU5_9BRAS|nr:unnamed protein product [Microthlaspi erraticum]